MKAYTFAAIELTYGEMNVNDIIGVQPAIVTFTFPDDVIGFDFTSSGEYGGDHDPLDIDFADLPEEFEINGEIVNFDAMDLGFVGYETFSNSYTEVFLIENVATQREYIIRLSGDPLPRFDTPSDVFAFQGNLKDMESLEYEERDLPLVFTEIAGFVSATPVGGPGSDTLTGSDGNDLVEGLGGDDRLSAGGGDDTILGGDGDDGLRGEDGNDLLRGDAGDDVLSGGAGGDTVEGGTGDDNLGGGSGDDSLDGGTGNDTLGGGLGDDSLIGGEGDDVIAGGAGDDAFLSGAGNDTVGGSFGDDLGRGGDGDDSLGGGAGKDSIDGEGGNDSIGGGEGDDMIRGAAGDDFLAGGGRDDMIDGGTGRDVINGGTGADQMLGGLGADLFIWNEADAGVTDSIGDFEDGIDRIRLAGVENAPGSGLEGRVDALNAMTIAIEGETAALLDYNGQSIVVFGVSADQLGVEDFVFI